MDLYNGVASAWMHHQPSSTSDPSPQLTQHEGQPSTDDWKDRSTPAVAGTSPSSQPSLDLSEFTMDLPGTSTSTSSIPSPPPPFYGHAYQNNYFLPPSVPGPYNAISYGANWANQSQLPLSNYSSLNGATTTTSAGSSLQQQQQQSTSQPMMIDPALTTMNGSNSNGITHQYSPPPNNYASSSAQQQPQRTPYPFQPQHLHPSALCINPSFVHSSHYFSPQQQQSSQQGTLSPRVLHSPSNPMITSVMPSTIYPMASGSQSLSPAARKEQFQLAVRPLLQASSFTGAQAVQNLVTLINDFGSQDIDPVTRLEILTKIRDQAGNHYFRAWSENPTAIDISREWLKAAFTAGNDSPLVETIMPLLHIIDRLPLTVESLRISKLGKLVVKLVKEPPTPAIKDMASNVERRWRQMVSNQETGAKSSDANGQEDTKSRKRKLSNPQIKLPPTIKKVAVNTPSRPTVKKEAKPLVTAVKDAKSDSSFFSAPKPKPKLPSFKKALAAPVKTELGVNVAQPSSIDPFQEALKSMAKARKGSPAAPTPPPVPIDAPSTTTGPPKIVKKKKSVTWAPEGQLELIKLIDKAVYDDDPVDGIHTTHSLRDLDRGEGAALHAQLFEEIIDWYEPLVIDIPSDMDRPRGQESQEKVAQEEREQTALGALYMSAAHIPDSPAEPSTIVSEEDVDKDIRMMIVGPELDTIFWSGPMSGQLPSTSVADLVGQLAMGSVDQSMGATPADGQGLNPKAFALDTGALPSLASMQSLSSEQLQQLLQQFAQPQVYTQHGQANLQPTYGSVVDQNWSSTPYADYGQGYDDDSRRWPADGSRGRGRARGRGRGRGDDGGYRHSKRKPCSFFAAGRCKYGDQCDFSHEPIF